MTETPKKLWLQIGYGDDGSHTWSENKTGEVAEEVEYIRMDNHEAMKNRAAQLLMNRGYTKEAMEFLQEDSE